MRSTKTSRVCSLLWVKEHGFQALKASFFSPAAVFHQIHRCHRCNYPYAQERAFVATHRTAHVLASSLRSSDPDASWKQDTAQEMPMMCLDPGFASILSHLWPRGQDSKGSTMRNPRVANHRTGSDQGLEALEQFEVLYCRPQSHS